MTPHPLGDTFAGVAQAYERGRPDYAPAVVGAITAELGLAPGAAVLDLAAGTGKLTRALRATGLDVLAVEPAEALRAVLAERIGPERVLAGSAEQIPVADGAVRAVTVADAFHWFDQARALREIARVLAPGGGLAVLSMYPDWGAASWAHELGGLVAGSRPQHPHFDGPPWHEAVAAAGGWQQPREVRITTTQPTSPERIVDHVASMSWIAAMPDGERQAMLARAREIVAAGETPTEMPVHTVVGLTSLL